MSSTSASAIHSFPPEILASIFELVYISTLEPSLSIVEDDEAVSYATVARDDPFPPSMFPYSLAYVCTFWRNVMSMFPAFWTHLVIFIDSSNPSSISDVRSHLEWSDNLPLRIIVTRHKDEIYGTDESEEARVKEVTAVLGPHIHRCHAIRYVVLHSNSLPSIPTHFREPLPHLEELHLIPFRQSLFPDPIYRSPAAYTTLSFPYLQSLQSLSMDGRNFVNLCLNFPNWITQLPSDHPISLNISQFQTSDCTHRFTLFDALESFTRITYPYNLKLKALEFDCHLDQLSKHVFNNGFMHTLEITDLSAELTAGLLYDGYNCWFNELTITHCPLVSIVRAPYSDDITFNDMASTEDFCPYLSTWEGTRLIFNNCPSVNDRVLQKLNVLIPEVPVFRLYAYRMYALHIHDCSNFSFATLRWMVEGRNARVAALNDNNGQDVNSALARVTITGRRPFLSPDDHAWLVSFNSQ